MKFVKMFLSLALVAMLASTSGAAVVGTVLDAQDSGGGVLGQNDFFSFGGWHDTAPLVASDGNIHAGLGHDDGAPERGLGAGISTQLPTADYVTALGGPLAGGNILRFSFWIANDPNDPMMNEGDWTESIKFEFNETVNSEIYPDGLSVQSGPLFPSGCDLSTGVCSDPGQINASPGWNLVAGEYELTAAQAGNAALAIIEPVLFVGDYTAGEAKDGSFFLDNLMVEIFADQAAADASPASASNLAPGGIVPEPTSAVLLLMGVCGLGLSRKRR